ncbi:MAG TPA: peptidylprolyl isomerase [Puia sp.]|nr:peptidylprolyl isomerase [Puia sp.]
MRNLTLKLLGAVLAICLSAINTHGQTLFSYGDKGVTKQDFLKAYTKNNIEGKVSEKSYRDYLELYIRYKLKVQAAYDLKLDTLTPLQTEGKNFRNQVADTYINDTESLNALVNEAYDRSKKDIHLAHIFIAVGKNMTPSDTLKAYKKMKAVEEALKSGHDFGATAAAYSDDGSAKLNHGVIGWITVFTLPYELETLAYNTKPMHFSFPYRSKAGYHIFKNLGERKAIGKIRVAHILIALPPNANDSVKSKAKQKADSIYQSLSGGANFGDLAKKYSGDNLSYQTGGEIADFGVGKYDSVFEATAFGLTKDGEIAKPILSSFGYHIIKRIARKPIPERSKETFDGLKQRVTADPRINISTKKFLDNIFAETHFKRYALNQANLWGYTDSALQHKTIPKFSPLDDSTRVFAFNNKDIYIKDWIDYLRKLKNTPAISPGKMDSALFDKFIETSALSYYREHLEDYNKDFSYQLNEFKEGNMLFEVMQRKIWDKAAVDSVGLKDYYNAHKEKYWWEPGADAVLFTCSNQRAAENVKSKLFGNPSGWRKLIDSSDGSAQADSGRFEMAQLPVEGKRVVPGEFTAFKNNPPDNTVTFAFVITLYNVRTPRTYGEARGFVINDYQGFLEDKWIGELKQKYPVKINEAVLKSLPR